MIRLLGLIGLILLFPVPFAQAQSRDVYTVRDIAVDERAATVIEAQQRAFASAKQAGLQRLIERITLPEDRTGANALVIDQATAEILAAAVDVEAETRGAGRYRGELAVVYNPANVRAFLTQRGINFTDTPAPKGVILPVADPALSASWQATWPDQSVGHLAPTVTSRTSGYIPETDWDEISGDIALYGAKRGILAQLKGRDGAYRVAVSSVTPSGKTVIGETPSVTTMAAAVDAVHTMLDEAWKRSSIVRDDGSRTLIEATVRYTSLVEWNTLRGALARSPLVSDFRTDAVSVDGAVVAFLYSGDGERLAADLRDRGVTLRMEPIGWVLTSAVTAAR